MSRVLIFVGLVLCSCSKKVPIESGNGANKDSLIQPLEVVEDTTSFPFSRILKENGYVYKLEGSEMSNRTIHFKSIGIFTKGKLHQKMNIDTISVLNEGEVYFNVGQDVNFDGLNDVELGYQAGNASSSIFLLYDGKTRKYEHYKPLDTIINPKIDASKKEIISNYHVGPIDTYFKVYSWEKGKLILQSLQIIGEDGEVNQYRKNGKWITR